MVNVMSNFTRDRAKGKMVCNLFQILQHFRLLLEEHFTTLSRHLENSHPEILVETNVPSAKTPKLQEYFVPKIPNQNSPRYQNDKVTIAVCGSARFTNFNC